MRLTDRSLRFLLYGHDSFGLGHFRRNLAIAAQLSADLPRASTLIITGCPTAPAFPLPPRTDVLKLPAITKDGGGRYCARHLLLDADSIRDMRAQLILRAATDFVPDAFIVDHSPAGAAGEVLPTLRYLRRRHPRTLRICGLRDIADDPLSIRKQWEADGIYSLFETVYDQIFVYGERDVFDVGLEYGLSAQARARLIFCGYLRRPDTPRPRHLVRDEIHASDAPLVLVTVGGGGDGENLIRTYVELLRCRLAEGSLRFASVVVTGPLMAPDVRERIGQVIQRGIPVTVLDFSTAFYSYVNAADLVVAMGGYNTVCETLSLGKPLLIVPRVHPRREQEIRAARLAARGLAEWIPPADLTPARLDRAISGLIGRDNRSNTARRLDMNGLLRLSRALRELLEDRPRFPSRLNRPSLVWARP